MTKSYRDRRGGHKPSDIEIGAGQVTWGPVGRRLAKKRSAHQMRREHRRIIAEALANLEETAHEDLLAEMELYDDLGIFEDFYQGDFWDIQSNELEMAMMEMEERSREVEEALRDDYIRSFFFDE